MNITISRKNEVAIKSIQKKFKQLFPKKKMPTHSEVVEALLASYAQAYLQLPTKYSDNDFGGEDTESSSSSTDNGGCL